MRPRPRTGEADPIAALTARYHAATAADLAELLAACAASDLATISRVAHRQAGLAGSFGADAVGEAAAAIDALAASGATIPTEAIDRLVAALLGWLADRRLS